MKTFAIHSLTAILLFATALAQEPSPEQIQQQIAQQLRYMQSPRQQVHFEADQLASIRASWNGQGAFMPLESVSKL